MRDNEYAVYAIMIIEGIIWAIAISVVLTGIKNYEKKLIELVTQVLNVTT